MDKTFVDPPSMPWHAGVITLFPEMFPGPLGLSLAGKALDEKRWTLHCTYLRDYAQDRHQSCDDTPCGGGPGMVLRPDVVGRAVDAALDGAPAGSKVIYMSPRGRHITQIVAEDLVSKPGVVILCGRFEGVDQRVLDHYDVDEMSIGDVILSGGEIPALALLDACIRLIPGVMGDRTSAQDESFSHGLLEYPHYTRPNPWNGYAVPDVLMSGHHKNIALWRRAKAEETTRNRRPDLWAAYCGRDDHRDNCDDLFK